MLNRQHKLQALIHDCVQIGSPKETQNHDHATNEDFAKCEKLQNEKAVCTHTNCTHVRIKVYHA